MGISNSQDRNFLKEDLEWDLPRLYLDLERVNHKQLSKSSKKYLEGVLSGLSPLEISQSYKYKREKASGTVRTLLARDIYPLIKILLKLPADYKIRWSYIPELLNNYKIKKEINTLSSDSICDDIFRNVHVLDTSNSKSTIIKNLLDKYCQEDGFTEEFLSYNTKNMGFREDWQYIVGKLVSETKEYLRAMVLDTELQQWWSSVAGVTYMTTNVDLLKRGVKIKRIFIMNSLDFRIRTNALKNAYIHNKIGVDVKILNNIECCLNMHLDADMLSVHDKDFIALYYFNPNKETTKLLLNGCSISSYSAFYDELFDDHQICKNIDEVISKDNLSSSFLSQVEQEVNLLYRYSCSNSVKDFLKILPN